LLTDLKQRGLLDDTLVIWGGEFGRTPSVEPAPDGKSKLGRDHNHYGFSVWFAGGGVRGARRTARRMSLAVEKPTSVHDLHATILHLLGFDHEPLTYRYAGRDFRLTDVSGQVIRDLVAS
jgi:arylsulfatase A-like enzyme